MTQLREFVRVVGDGDDQDHAVTPADRPHADAAAFCAAEWPQLVRALSLYVGDPYVAEELAQEALLRACRRWSSVSQLDSPGGWTWRAATDLANSHFRRRRAARRAHQRIDNEDRTHLDPDGGEAVAVWQAVAGLAERQGTAGAAPRVGPVRTRDCRPHGHHARRGRSLTKRATATLRGQLGEQAPVSTQEVHDA